MKLLQYRDKQAGARELLEKSRAIAELARQRNALFFVNDRPDVAYLAGAGGVHVGQHDLHCEQVRAVIGSEKFVGVSTHNLEQFAAAASTLIGQGDYALALEIIRPGLLRHPGSINLAGLRRTALHRLMEDYQQTDPFKFLIYAEQAGAEIGPVE